MVSVRKIKGRNYKIPPNAAVDGKKERRSIQHIKRQLINSKGAICGICGGAIADMKDCTIDHILPISKGGLSILENCRLAHKHCNVKRGANND